MLRSITVTLAGTLALALAACGSGDDSGASTVTPETAKTTIERAAELELAAVPVPEEAREQGLSASYSNAATAVKDKQVVALFVMKDGGVADKVSDMVRSSAPKSARMIVNDEIMVVYAAAGSDHGPAVEKAVKAL
jgi:hypothetical protein